MIKNVKYYIMIIGMLFFCVYGISERQLEAGFEAFIISRLGLGGIEISSGGIMLLVNAMFPVFLVQLVEGIHIYKHYTIGSVYYFVRQKNIKNWFRNESVKLLKIIFNIYLIYIALGYLLGCLIYGVYPAISTICMALCQCATYVLYTYIFVMLINCMAIILGADIAYVVGVGIQLVFVLVLMIFEKTAVTPQNVWMLRFNPITCMAIVWHYIPGIYYGNLNKVGVEFDVAFSVLYLAVIAVTVYSIGKAVIVNRDIAMENKEEQG